MRDRRGRSADGRRAIQSQKAQFFQWSLPGGNAKPVDRGGIAIPSPADVL